MNQKEYIIQYKSLVEEFDKVYTELLSLSTSLRNDRAAKAIHEGFNEMFSLIQKGREVVYLCNDDYLHELKNRIVLYKDSVMYEFKKG